MNRKIAKPRPVTIIATMHSAANTLRRPIALPHRFT